MTRDAEHTPSPQSVVVPLRGPGHCDDDAAWAEFVRQYDGQPRSRPDLTDFALANRVFMADRTDLDLIVWQTAAKERIRWLSIELAKAQAALSAAPAPSSLAGGWRSPTEVPEAKKGEHAYRIVAVKRADGEKVVTFSAFYMNAVPLWFEDDNESRNVTGWHSDSEGDDGPTYSPLLMGGDVLMGWREFPQWEAALSPEAPARIETPIDALVKALTPRHEAPASEEERERLRMAYKTGYADGVEDSSGMFDRESCEEGWGQYAEKLSAQSVRPARLPLPTVDDGRGGRRPINPQDDR